MTPRNQADGINLLDGIKTGAKQFGRVVFFFAYLTLGALVFKEIENASIEENNREAEELQNQITLQARQELGILIDSPINSSMMQHVFQDIGDSPSPLEIREWRLMDGLKFCWSAATTIGYGHIVPISDQGKIAYIFYSFFGIPLCLYVFAAASIVLTVISKRVVTFIELRLLKRRRVENLERKAVAFSLLSFIVQLFSMAGLYSRYHGSFTNGLYYWFTTYTTIGFGDLDNRNPTMDKWWSYLISRWFHVFGLGTLASIMQLGNRALTKADGRSQREAFHLASTYLVRKLKGSDSGSNRVDASNMPNISRTSLQPPKYLHGF